ncbi:MAG TPA: glycogen debranching N-terminal domain-containing protein, partial [Ktedonobacterales bacterium]|nr:glycogen debranching N-terminal domain-containing protein [Ktedonobacterales bacterium]
MAEHTRDFFLELARQHTSPYLRGINGTCRFFISGAGIWHVTIDDGHIAVSQQDLPAETTVTCDDAVFDQIVRGEANMLVMRLQDRLHMTGNRAVLYIMQRLFPPPAITTTRPVSSMPEHPESTSAMVIAVSPDDEPQQIPTMQTVSVLTGNNFVVSGRNGDIDAQPTDTQGLFSYDTRFLSRWLLTINGVSPRPLSTDDLQYYSIRFFGALATG